jgi:hypothetical protein
MTTPLSPSESTELRELLIDYVGSYESFDGLSEATDKALVKIQALIDTQVRLGRNEPVTIMGKTIDEVCVILSALELERITDIEVTMDNLDKLAKKMREDIWEANQKAINHAVNSYIDFNQLKNTISQERTSDYYG